MRFCLYISLALAALLPAASGADVVQLQSVTSSGYEIEVHFLPQQMQLTPVVRDGMTFSKLQLEGAHASGQAGEPAIPVLNRMIVVNAGQTYHISYEAADPAVFTNVLLYPVQPDHRENQPAPVFTWNRAGYMTAQASTSKVELLPTAQIGHLTMLPIRIAPIAYNAATGTLTVFQTVRIHIQTSGPTALATRSLNGFERMQLKNLALNGGTTLATLDPNAAGALMIITSDTLLPEAQSLATALHNDRQVIFKTVAPAVTMDQLKALVVDGYTNSHVDSVLIYGNETVVPGGSWDGNTSDSYLTYVAGNDNYADLSVGRIPAANLDDAKFLNTKIERFVTNRQHGTSDPKKVMLVAHNQDYPGAYTANQEAIRTAPNPRNFVYNTQYGGAGATNDSVLKEAVNGYSIINYRGHGSDYEWWQWDSTNTSFTTDLAANLHNLDTNMSVFFDIACENGMFEYPKLNMAETLLFLPAVGDLHRGAASVLASTGDSYTEINDRFDLHIFNFLETSDDVSLGHIVALANNQLVLDDNGQMNDNIKMYVLFGDPLMTPWQ